MPSQQLLLSWKDHNGAVVSVFESLLRRNTLVDCTLAAEGQYLKAHKVVLSACSSYFELLFSQESEKNPIVVLKDVKFQELKAAVNFMYKGEVEVCEDRLEAFLEVADSLQIKGLGSEGEIESQKENLSGKRLNSKSPVSPRQPSKKDPSSSRSDSAGQSPNVPADCELVKNNESSSARQSSQSESALSSRTLPHSTSSDKRGQSTCGDQDNLETGQSSSTTLPSGENEQSDINPDVKTEPVTDMYEEEKSEEADRDFGEDITMEDEEDWDAEDMSEHSTNQQEHGFTPEFVKVEEGSSENVEDVGEPSGNYPSSEGSNWSQENDGVKFSSMLPKDAPSTSSSWSHQEPYGGAESGPSDGTPAASTGAARRLDQGAAHGSQDLRQSVRTGGRYEHRFSPISGRPTNPASHPGLSKPGAHRSDAEMYSCPVCFKNFSWPSLLESHMRVHEGLRPFPCPHCDYAAARPPALTVHLRTHTGERPYKCPECGVGFTVEHNMTRHLRTMHPMAAHKTTQRVEKPFKCPECGNQFTIKCNMIRHMRSFHGRI